MDRISRVNQENEFYRSILIQQNNSIKADFSSRKQIQSCEADNKARFVTTDVNSVRSDIQLPCLNQAAVVLNNDIVSI